MDVSTGFVLDFEVLCNICRTYSTMQKKTRTYLKSGRGQCNCSGNCECKFSGLSEAMEKKAALRMWRRTEQEKYLYVTFISDGDSSAYSVVTVRNDGQGQYGDIKIVKEEYINHVQKRLETRLRKVKEEQTTKQ